MVTILLAFALLTGGNVRPNSEQLDASRQQCAYFYKVLRSCASEHNLRVWL